MDAGQDEKLIEIHSRAMDFINQTLIELQDETIKRTEDDSAELRAKLRDAERERDHWKEIAETDHWPYEWTEATRLKSERDEYKVRLEACGNFDLRDTPKEIAEVILSWQTVERDKARKERDELAVRLNNILCVQQKSQ